MGKPPQCALPKSTALPVGTSVLPPRGSTTDDKDKDRGKEKKKEQ
jgi:hypothetical protein